MWPRSCHDRTLAVVSVVMDGNKTAQNGGLFGVIHVPPMPADPKHDGRTPFSKVIDAALRDAESLATGGVDGLIVENFGSAPFFKGSGGQPIPAHQAAVLTLIVARCVSDYGLPVGVNCLRNDAMTALGIAAAAGAKFVRVNVHIGAYLTDQGIIEGEAADTLRYRSQLGAATEVWADVLVKHAEPLVATDPEQAVEDTVHRGLADAIIVTGKATGSGVELDRLMSCRAAAPNTPIFIGSGFRPEVVEQFAPLVEGAIVGTWLKHEGRVERAVDASRVRELVELCQGRFRS